ALGLLGFSRIRPTARIGLKIGHSCGPPPKVFGGSVFTRCEQFDSPPSLKLRRTAFVSTGLPAEAAKQRGLVGGSGIGPLTPSMSRLGNDLKNQLFRCLAPGLLPGWRRQQHRCAFGFIGDEVMDVRRDRSRVFPAPGARQRMVVHAATNAPRRIAVAEQVKAAL